MIITLNKSAKKEEILSLQMLLHQNGLGHCLSIQETQPVVGVEKNAKEELIQEIQRLSCVEKVIPVSTPYKLARRAFKPEKTRIKVRDIEIGGNEIILMAGPCAIESLEQLLLIAEALKQSGVKVLRGSAFKPRTSPYSFQGMGIEGLKWHKEAQKQHGLVIETEIMDVRDIDIVAEHVDILRVGARNMQNFNLLKEIGRSKKPVILKRGLSSTLEEWLMSAEYIMAHGNPHVILCERGIRTFEQSARNTLDLSSVAIATGLTHLPIIVDPSHAAGRKDIIPSLSRAAVAAGADGLLIEVHHEPSQSKCDAQQALSPEELHEIKDQMQKIAIAIGRTL